MTEIKRGVFTLINTFKVATEKQQALIDLLNAATAEVMVRQPGFVSATIHRGLDGKTVANYAQWESRDAFEAMQKNPEARQHMSEAAKLAESFEPFGYEVDTMHRKGAS